ncbi:tRNA pseudouridine(55) synthase TruB [Acidipropionibacterium jensenii]|uniref:tRNA pseudouridine(55) synthase TruB n=1 Tax=Acidipropionibacterium jensenii TaxID=1749 RepID=UPI00110A1DBA|nr:tRNA pseudouridine(55) synthase TruB [Acidipropionibacterium jensenii]MDN5977938.1 tRNA pseudouridine(55) synthase TruB [Acidipropionibacterium jensenii]MDN5996869.1 tRNA pseudouridine(55) synthase TruB [Acidipropionibacterium jensenii]MDN6427857.1 tRNA pseudouridine(55) synthase TruB [Acidipropionibacterium jensenii]MDN6480290.1 tRNA pseudouridine(55) synthase TruB [Acidipropionibacterium jensenii]MDN6512688.1 tRNA pseudouridine(55) synthase TruB [Acidipropionibacterium jensenii]
MDSGLLIIDKPSGWTSHQVVGRVRRLMGTRKVGHAGTLDPMATGVLVVGVGRATRLLGHLALHDKDYTATIRLGVATLTDDAEGEIVSTADASALTDEQIEAAMGPLRGDIMQVPTAVSAIKVNGRRSYARVRAGEQVELAARPVTVSRFECTALRRTVGQEGTVVDLDAEVSCSTGTYVRALARDLGAALGVGGHLTALRRTRIGPYRLPDVAVDLSDEAPRSEMMTMAQAARLSFPVVELDAAQEADLRVGRRLEMVVPADPTAMISGGSGDLLALYRPDPERPGWSRALAVLV